jgi:hypothetical protein
MRKGATISNDDLYRYRLSRHWDESLPAMTWIMLNPSTADAMVDDPTIRKCMGFARRHECGGIEVVNLYALRTSKPKHLLDHPDPEGPENVMMWKAVLSIARGPIVAAWGAAKPKLVPMSEALLANLDTERWVCLGRTKTGLPLHPGRIGYDRELVRLWS